MRDPERQLFGTQPHAVGFGVHLSGEVLDADEGDPAAVHHQLAGIRRAHPHHEDAIGRAIDPEHLLRARQRLLGEPGHVHPIEQREEIAPVGTERPGDHLGGVRTVEIEDVVAPVRGQQGPVCIDETVKRGFRIGLCESGEKVGKQIDKHATR